jgi:hypothetical protein
MMSEWNLLPALLLPVLMIIGSAPDLRACMWSLLPVLLLPALMVIGCAPDLRTRVQWSNGSSTGEGDPVGVLDTGADLTETTEVMLDATDHEEWIRYDFERQGVVDEDLPWDLSFRRYLVVLNGGVSGDGGVEAAVIPNVRFDDLDGVPEGTTWATDTADSNDDGVDETVLAGWYDYDSSTHVLTANGSVYLVRTAEDAVVKFEMLNYYDDSGTPGHVRFHWAQLAPAP